MTATLNITYAGRSGDVSVGATVTDHDARRIAAEVIRSGTIPGIHSPRLRDTDLEDFVIDRFHEDGRATLYLRPKVPFGDVERVSEI